MARGRCSGRATLGLGLAHPHPHPHPNPYPNPKPKPKPKPNPNPNQVLWSYDVRWEYSDVKWASRWDVYLYATDEQIHWFSIVNSFMIVLFLSGMLAMIMVLIIQG